MSLDYHYEKRFRKLFKKNQNKTLLLYLIQSELIILEDFQKCREFGNINTVHKSKRIICKDF